MHLWKKLIVIALFVPPTLWGVVFGLEIPPARGPYPDIFAEAKFNLNTGDTLQAYRKFEKCLNFKDCPIQAHLYMAQIEKNLYKDDRSYIKRLEIAGDYLDDAEILLEVAEYHLKKNSPDLPFSWRKLTFYPQTKKKAHEVLTQYYLKIGNMDSLRIHRDAQRTLEKVPQIVVSDKVMELLKTGQWKTLLSRVNSGTLPMVASDVLNTLKSLESFENGDTLTAFPLALKGYWNQNFPFSMARPRLFALYRDSQYAQFIKESSSYTSSVREDKKLLSYLATSYLMVGNKEQAHTRFLEAKAIGQSQFDFPRQWATLFLEIGNRPVAKFLLRSPHVEQTPENLISLSQILESEDSLNQALELSQRAYQLTNSYDVSMYHGLLCIRASRFSDAEQALKNALKIKPNSSEALAHLEQVYETLGQRENRLAILQEMSNLSPEEPSLWLRYARQLLLQGDQVSAEKWLKKCMALHYSPEVVVPLLARTTLELNKTKEAKGILETFLLQFPQHRLALRTYLSLGILNTEEKQKTLSALLEIDSTDVGLYRQYHELLKNSAFKPEGYYTILENYYKISPSQGDVLEELIAWSQSQNNIPKSVRYLEDWASTHDDVPSLKLLLHIKQTLGLTDESLEIAKKIFNQVPSDTSAEQVYHLYIAKADSVAAFKFLSAYLAQVPQSSWALGLLSFYQESQSLDKSLNLAKKSFEANSSDKVVAYHFSKLMLKKSVVIGKVPPARIPAYRFVYTADSVHFLNALENYSKGDFEVALNHFEGSGKLFETQAQPYVWYIYTRKGLWDQILSESERLNIQQLDSLSLESFALAHYHKGKIKEYLQHYEKLESRLNKYPISKMVAGFSYYAHYNFPRAEKLLAQEPLAEWKKDVFWVRSQLLFRSENWIAYNSSMVQYEKDLDHLDTMYYQWGISTAKAKSLKEGASIWERGYQRHPKSVLLLEKLSEWSCTTEYRSACIRYSEQMQELSPGHLASAKWLARIYLKSNQPSDAEKILTTASIKADLEIEELLTEAYFSLENYPQTIHWGEKVVRRSRNTYRPHYILAKAYEHTGEFEKSHEHFYQYSKIKNSQKVDEAQESN